MQFIDEVKINIKAGDGGDGAAAFRRERFRPNGGPAGGDGGNGGSIVFRADENLGTLLDLRYRHKLTAGRGQNGGGKDRYGKRADDLIVPVPLGTTIFDEDTGEIISDLVKHNQQFVAADGGKGGLGNIHFVTSSNQAPTKATPGYPGEIRNIRLELKLLADVGLVGLPSVGKSSLISRLSSAKPRVAQYPFTTLVPNLGVVDTGPGTSFVMADIPGLISGASNGAGLGIRFLKHIQRTALLLYVVAPDETEENDLYADFETLRKEVLAFDADLAKRSSLLLLNKSDLSCAKSAEAILRNNLDANNIELLTCSAATSEGLADLKKKLAHVIAKQGKEDF